MPSALIRAERERSRSKSMDGFASPMAEVSGRSTGEAAIARSERRSKRFSHGTIKHLCPICHAGGRVDVVFDCYWDVSIKATEWQRRAVDGQLNIKITSKTQKCPKQWAKVLNVGSNKTAIIEFLVNEWQDNCYASLLPSGCLLYVTSGMKCWRFSSGGGQMT